jgi:hypothetical protein
LPQLYPNGDGTDLTTPSTNHQPISTMNINDLNQLCNDLLEAYLTDKSSDECIAIALRYHIEPGSKIWDKATNRAIGWLEGEGDFEHLSEANRDRLFHKSLAREGGILGVNYSKTADGYLISRDLLDRMGAKLPAGKFDRMKELGMIRNVEAPDPYRQLDEHLGVPFFDNLLAAIVSRVKGYSDVEAIFYIGVIFQGFIEAHPWGGDLLGRILTQLGDRRLAIWNERANDTEPEDPDGLSSNAWADMLIAMGLGDAVKERNFGDHVGTGITIDGIAALDKVWRGSDMRPAVLAAKLRAASKR